MEQAKQFLDWCKEFGNSPDGINLLWWLNNRTTFGYPGDAEYNTIMKYVREQKAVRDLL